MRPSEDPRALDPRHDRDTGMNPPREPWFQGRFGPGVPSMDFTVSPFDHVMRGNGNPFKPGPFRGNTGFGGPGGPEIGALSEDAKTGMTGLLLLGALAVLFVVYKK